jgi:hypothetical protein
VLNKEKEGEMKKASPLRWALMTAVVLAAGIVPVSAYATPPSNDNFAAAKVLEGRSTYADGINDEATKEAGEPNHAGNPGGASVWFEWTAPGSGKATLSVCYGEFDTLLAVYTGDQLGDLQEVASNDDNDDCGQQSKVTFSAASGVTYHIAVDGKDGATGYFELDAWLGPPNDDFAQSIEVAGDSGSVTGDNYFATSEPGEPSHGPYSGSSVWYRWTAPSSGTASFDLCDSGFDTLLAAYTGDDVAHLTQVVQNDDDCPTYGGSRVSFTAGAGQVYRIAVDGAYGDWGPLTLKWSRNPLVPRNTVLPAIVGRPVDGAVLTAAEGVWSGTPPFTYGYQWMRCFYGGNCTTISDATGSTYTLVSADVGAQVIVVVTATNAGGSASAYSDHTGTVSPVAPANITAPSIDGAPYLGADLDVDDGDWSGSQPMTYSYRWQRCDAADSCEDIDGATDGVHTVTAEDIKTMLRVVVTASNGAGSATAVSSLTRRATRKPVCIVPRVKGKKLAVARRAIRKAHCAVGRVRRARSRRAGGRVVAQSLRPGLRRPMGTKVNLVVSRGRS